MATEETLSKIFNEFGFDLSDDVIDRCQELCITYDITDPREFVESYVAFSVNYLEGVEINSDTLVDFERKELASKKNKQREPAPKHHVDLADFEEENMMEDDIMDSYICQTPKTPRGQSRIPNTPDVTASPREIGIESPSLSRNVSGKAIYTFGTAALIKHATWSATKKQIIKIIEIGQQKKLENKYGFDDRCMFDTLLTKCELAADQIYDIGQKICDNLIKTRPTDFNEELLENLCHIDVPSTGTVRCIGRIFSDNDCQLDANSLLLAGADEMKIRTAILNVRRIDTCSLFPGEVVMVQGTNPRGHTVYVDDIFTEIELKPSEPPRVHEKLEFVIVAGPYTSQNDLSYEPLNDIIVYCKQHKPDVLIMLGPFLDADHKCVQDGSMKKTFEDFFHDLLAGMMEAIGTETEVLIVSSYKDAHSSFVYPTYAYTSRQIYSNLHLLPDPCKIKINGVSIGLTSTDILNHLQEFEIAINGRDKIRRFFNYLVHQQSFYPLNPPAEEVPLDSELTKKYASLDFVPNLMILPSSMNGFIRDLNNCLVINPGHLTVNGSESTRGTFGRLVITPTNDFKSLSNYIASQIVKI